jgi:hypothetical protein
MTRKGVAPAVAAGVGLVLLLLAGAAAFSMVNEDLFSIGQGDDCEWVEWPQESEKTFETVEDAKEYFESGDSEISWERYKKISELQERNGVVKVKVCTKK